jgi:hypothetical protein
MARRRRIFLFYPPSGPPPPPLQPLYRASFHPRDGRNQDLEGRLRQLGLPDADEQMKIV